MLTLHVGGRSLKLKLDLNRNSRQNWGMGGHSYMGPLLYSYMCITAVDLSFDDFVGVYCEHRILMLLILSSVLVRLSSV